jgi:osmotically-inducible protein OsmY
MVSTKLLSEVERQQKYLNQLPASFTYPLFNSKKALESQRQSGYRNTAAAAREIVDNAVEAHADQIHVVFERGGSGKKSERKNSVSAVAFIDNGSGMLPEMARYALSWGGGTHFDDHDFIGKFGFGLPNASVNQARRVEVYTRTKATEAITKAWLDIDDYTGEGVVQEIKPPVTSELPAFVSEHLKANAIEFEHGTVVVWVKPDKLTYRTAALLREHLLDDFGATYRYLLKNFSLKVDGVEVLPLNPLFLDPAGRFYRKPEEGGAVIQYDAPISVSLVFDPETGERHLKKNEDLADLTDKNVVASGAINIRVARFPLGLVVGGAGVAGIEPVDEFAGARFEIRKSRRGMSFVRSGREIETVDAFPRRASDRSSGLGDWPLLQSYAYHWGLEVSFQSTLDTVFGITNDKQQVRPIEDFWRLLADEEIDQLLRREDAWQRTARSQAATEQRKAKLLEPTADALSPAEVAATAADAASGDRPSVPQEHVPKANLNFEKRAQEKSRSDKKSIEEARKALEDQARRKKYQIDYFDEERGPFYVPEWVGTQVVVKVNRKHPFFTVLYDSILALEGGSLAKEAIDVLLITLARAELQVMNSDTADFYLEQRENRWSPFLASALRTLGRKFPAADEDAAA